MSKLGETMKPDYRTMKYLNVFDMYSTMNNVRTIYRIDRIELLDDIYHVQVQVFDFQTKKFNKTTIKKYSLNEEVSVRTSGQVLNRIFKGSIN